MIVTEIDPPPSILFLEKLANGVLFRFIDGDIPALGVCMTVALGNSTLHGHTQLVGWSSTTRAIICLKNGHLLAADLQSKVMLVDCVRLEMEDTE